LKTVSKVFFDILWLQKCSNRLLIWLSLLQSCVI